MEAHIDIRTVNGVPVLGVMGELDVYTSPKLKAAVDSVLDKGHVRLLVNLLEATYLDSTALSILTSALKRVQSAGGNLGLIYTQPLLDRLFTVTGLTNLFPVFRSEIDALAAAVAWARNAPDA